MRKELICVMLVILAVAIGARAQTRASLENPGFEAPSIAAGASEGDAPDQWFYFSSIAEDKDGITDRKKHDGMQSLIFESKEKFDAYAGFAQKFTAKAGHRYEFSVYAINDSSDPLTGESYGQVSIEWLGEDGQEIGRTYGPAWNFDLSPIRWEKFLVGDVAPEGAAQAQAVITFFSRDSEGFGTCYIDDSKIVDKGTE